MTIDIDKLRAAHAAAPGSNWKTYEYEGNTEAVRHGWVQLRADLRISDHSVFREGIIAVNSNYPQLAADLRSYTDRMLPGAFITVPETTLPNGTVVSAFQVSQYHATRREDGTPWVEVNYHDARAAAECSGLTLITETQWLAIAHNIAQQPINWTSGTVGEGKLFQGMRNGNVDGAQPHSYEPEDADERRWHELSNGERIYDMAGHVFSWVFDDMQGDDAGLIAKPFSKDSPSFTTSPASSLEKGVGWMPSAGVNWSGDALCRGGYWYSVGDAGVFYLNFGRPVSEYDYVGFRCTKSL